MSTGMANVARSKMRINFPIDIGYLGVLGATGVVPEVKGRPPRRRPRAALFLRIGRGRSALAQPAGDDMGGRAARPAGDILKLTDS